MIRSARTRRHTFRPRLDALEDRQLLSAGDLDTATFNAPNGFVLTPFTQTSKGKTTTSGQAWAVQIQSDGKIVAAGWAFGDFALARYNSDGSLDTTFGSGGKVLTAFNKSQGARGSDLVIQPDGKILVAGYSDQGTGRGPNDDFAVAQLQRRRDPGHHLRPRPQRHGHDGFRWRRAGPVDRPPARREGPRRGLDGGLALFLADWGVQVRPRSLHSERDAGLHVRFGREGDHGYHPRWW